MEKSVISVMLELDASRLPSVPHVLLQLIDICNHADVCFSDLENIIRQDAALSSKVLAAANSPIYRQWGSEASLGRLLVVLGLNTVKTIAMTSAVQDLFSQVDDSVSQYMDEIWLHSLTCAHTARAIARLTTYQSPDEAYIAGLLHRVGQLVLLRNFPTEYSGISVEPFSGQELEKLENEKLGFTHSEVGAYLIDSWHLHSFMADAVHYQYEPAVLIQDSTPLVKIINLASQLSCLNGTPDNTVFKQADELFGLTQPLLEEMLNSVDEQVSSIAKSLGISLTKSAKTGNRGIDTTPVRKQLKEQLKERIKTAAIVGMASHRTGPQVPLNETLASIVQNARILFDLTPIRVFLYDQELNQLTYTPSEETESGPFADISISLEAGRSMITDSLLQGEPRHWLENSENRSISIVDRQILTLMKNNGLLSIPLITEGRTVGVLVAGIEQVDWNRIESHLMLVSTFADGAAKSIQQQITIIRSEEERIEEARSEFQLHARKIIHEANNPLGIINNYLHILGTKLGENHAAQEELRIIKDEIERVGNIILRLRDMPSDDGLEQGFVDLNNLILDVEKIFHTSLFVTHDISAQLDLETSLPPVAGSRNTLKQILTNLIKNSVEAMSDGGKITLITKDKINMNGKHYVGIEVIDNGPGIPDEIMENIFSPVKSTKGAGNAGLGLTIVKNLINELSGSISCTSSHEKGTTFQILLPRRIPMGDT